MPTSNPIHPPRPGRSRRAGLVLLAALGLAATGQATAPLTARAVQLRNPRHPHCDRPLIRCGRRCVAARTDPQHCGTCATRCAATQECQDGQCVTAVTTPATR